MSITKKARLGEDFPSYFEDLFSFTQIYCQLDTRIHGTSRNKWTIWVFEVTQKTGIMIKSNMKHIVLVVSQSFRVWSIFSRDTFPETSTTRPLPSTTGLHGRRLRGSKHNNGRPFFNIGNTWWKRAVWSICHVFFTERYRNTFKKISIHNPWLL